jgi:hypothetical protein
LRNSLYSRKAEAACRECCCNSLDAHTEAGISETPIEVTLPSLFEPVFKVRDYGKSMSDEIVRDIYSYYGKSTKRTSNQAVGGFGIGKLSPLCIAPAFQLTCIQNGYKRIYTIYVNEQNIDQIDLIFEGKTGEKTGTEVSFGVKPADIESFKIACQKVFRFWPTHPIIHNCEDYEKEVVEYHLLKPNRWGFTKDGSTSVVSGPIAYSLDYTQIPDLSDTQKSLLKKGMVIFVGIGDVTLQASRESISYTPKTIKFLQNKIREIEKEIVDEVKVKLDSLKTECDGRRFFHNIFTDLGELSVIADLVKKDIKIVVNGVPIVEDFFRVQKEDNITLLEISRKRDRSYNLRVRLDETQIFQYFKAEKAEKCCLFYDLKRSKNGRVKNLCRYYFSEGNLGEYQMIYVVQVGSIDTLKKYCEKTGIDFGVFQDINETIILPKKVRDKTKRNPASGNCKIYDLDDEYEEVDDEIVDGHDSEPILTLDLDFSKVEKAYYIFSHYGKYYYDAGLKDVGSSLSDIHKFLKHAAPDYADNPIIYIIPVKNKDKITPNFKRIGEILPGLLAAHYDKPAAEKVSVNELHTEYSYPLTAIYNQINKGEFVPSEKLARILDQIDFSKSPTDPFKNLSYEFQVKTKSEEIQKLANKLSALTKEFMKSYPIFTDVSYYRWGDKNMIQHYLEYITLIDEKNSKNSLEVSSVTA